MIDPIQWCKDRLWVPPNPLCASLLFVDAAHRDPILALRALSNELAQITSLSHEPGLAHAKLNWWRQALMENRAHPAIDALVGLGVRDRLSDITLLALCDAIESSLSTVRYQTTAEAWDVCLALGGQAALLEAQMLSGEKASEADLSAIQALGAGGYWLRLIRDIALDAKQGRWFVPLELQADHQITRQQVLDGTAGRAWHGLIEALVSIALVALDQAEQQLASSQAVGAQHLRIMAAVDRRLGHRLLANPEAVFVRRILPAHFGNVWTAWRQARQVSKR